MADGLVLRSFKNANGETFVAIADLVAYLTAAAEREETPCAKSALLRTANAFTDAYLDGLDDL